ncbi:hypothetical protein HO173_008877 [Letharia columbiana]|uniref:Uncharacterized protein n=1 Tax=Letharia columbiana TaxID=112416 RepID=A0A8H6L2A3_9LECA|nr:uncharacterized protein HO173_008877 [Letharia columbiana]KAF6232914.1 hypothetical protein HO173_008877 [Letharia columbiana]
MPTHEIPWPQWTREENIICVWFSALGLAIPDIARIIEYKLGRPTRHPRGYFRQMDRINQEEAERGRPRLCGRDMLDWDRAAVDNFLILRTDDTDLLDHLLWFGEEHLGLLRTYLGRGIPLNEAVDVEDMQYQWARLLSRHQRFYGNPARYGGGDFF